jgi:hypothetical protein
VTWPGFSAGPLISSFLHGTSFDTIRRMNFFLASAAWLGIGIFVGVGIFNAAKGHPLMLIIAFVLLFIANAKIGCSVSESHSDTHSHH